MIKCDKKITLNKFKNITFFVKIENRELTDRLDCALYYAGSPASKSSTSTSSSSVSDDDETQEAVRSISRFVDSNYFTYIRREKNKLALISKIHFIRDELTNGDIIFFRFKTR